MPQVKEVVGEQLPTAVPRAGGDYHSAHKGQCISLPVSLLELRLDDDLPKRILWQNRLENLTHIFASQSRLFVAHPAN